jgi:hypothetical protein
VKLKKCIADTGALNMARIMYFGVRLGSYSPIKYPQKKWNHGWKNRPEFQSLTIDDIISIESELARGYDFISYENKESFIEQLRSRLD